jgi:hypothetical protein
MDAIICGMYPSFFWRFKRYLVFLICTLAVLLGGCVIFAWLQPTVLFEWVKIYPDGSQKSGQAIKISEGRGFEGEPDELPGLVISKWSQDIGLEYTDATGRQLEILWGGDFEHHYQLSARHVDAGKIWTTQVFERFLSINEQFGSTETRLSYSRVTHKLEKHIKKSSATWDGVDFQLTPESRWTVTRYQEGRHIAVMHTASIDEANQWRDQWSDTTDADYVALVHNTLKNWQREMAHGTQLPALENETYASLKAKYF